MVGWLVGEGVGGRRRRGRGTFLVCLFLLGRINRGPLLRTVVPGRASWGKRGYGYNVLCCRGRFFSKCY